MFHIGLVSISFRKHSCAEILDECVKCGIEKIEWGSDVHAKYDDENNLQNIAALTKDHNMIVSSYGTYYRLTESTEVFTKYCKAAAILKTDKIRVWGGIKSAASMTEDDYIALKNMLNSCADIADMYGQSIILESHGGTVTDDAKGAIKLLESLGGRVGLCYQPNQYISDEQNAMNLKMLLPYVSNVHTFYWQGDHRYSLDRGRDAWRKYIDILSTSGRDHNMLLEFMPDNDICSLSRETDILRELLLG